MARRTVVILGGTGGIGICTVRKFFKEEECDVITVSYNKDEIAAAEKEFANPNGSFKAYYASVSDVDAMTKIYKEIDDKFGHLIRALELGAPPHGGIALGLDRIVMLLAGKSSIRDVIAFPKTSSASDPMTGAPSAVTARQLKEVSLRTL